MASMRGSKGKFFVEVLWFHLNFTLTIVVRIVIWRIPNLRGCQAFQVFILSISEMSCSLLAMCRHRWCVKLKINMSRLIYSAGLNIMGCHFGGALTSRILMQGACCAQQFRQVLPIALRDHWLQEQ